MKRVHTDPATSARLGRVRQKNTKPELALRRWLWRQGYRYVLHKRGLPGSPDISNSKRKWAIFVHGCFWHGHESCRKATVPKRNREFWRAKIEANRLRDRAKEARLQALGYDVFVVWECQLSELMRNGERPPTCPLPPPPHQDRLVAP